MKRLLLPTLACAIICQAAAPFALAQLSIGPIQLTGFQKKKVAAKPGPAYTALMRKWIVRSVRRDGEPNAAQIGQKVGDIITVKKNGNQLALG